MSNCEVPSWNLSHQRQGLHQVEEENKSFHLELTSNHNQHHLQQPQSFSQFVPMSNYEVAELTWENGQLALHELGGIFPPPTSSTSSQPNPSAWEGTGTAYDTLESIVHQATYFNPQHGPNLMPATHQAAHNLDNVGSVVASSGGKWAENSGPLQTPALPPPPGLVKKRTRSESDHCCRNNFATSLPNDHESACASANAAFCKDNNDKTMMTWASLESPRSCTRTKTTNDEDSACHGGSENQEEERDTKGETGPSHTPRKGRAAAVHNQSERRRRDRINQKMKALQKLVPNASKTDKASMLDEVIEYLKQLQAQVQMLSNAGFMPQFMMPFGMQQHVHQMSFLARMGMGMGIGMLDPTSNCHTTTPSHPISQLIHPNQVAQATSGYVPSAFVAPQMIPATQQPNVDTGAGTSGSLLDPYSTLLAQSMSLDLYNRIATLQRQQQAQAQKTSNQIQSNNQIQGD